MVAPFQQMLSRGMNPNLAGMARPGPQIHPSDPRGFQAQTSVPPNPPQIHQSDPRGFQTQTSAPLSPPPIAATQPQQSFGLSGFEQAQRAGLGAGVSALEGGMTGALGTLQTGYQQAQQQLGAANQALSGNFSATAARIDPNTGQQLFQKAADGAGAFSPAGLQAQQLQSALSGAQGQEAFNQALINSPIQKFLQEQGQQAVVNQAAATGGVGGGAVQQELQRVGQGIAGQHLQQQIQNLHALSGL